MGVTELFCLLRYSPSRAGSEAIRHWRASHIKIFGWRGRSSPSPGRGGVKFPGGRVVPREAAKNNGTYRATEKGKRRRLTGLRWHSTALEAFILTSAHSPCFVYGVADVQLVTRWTWFFVLASQHVPLTASVLLQFCIYILPQLP